MSQESNTDPKPSRMLSANHLPKHPDDQLLASTFTIATPAVTTILPLTENISDTSFMSLPSNYQQDTLADGSMHTDKPSTNSMLKLETADNTKNEVLYGANEIDKTTDNTSSNPTLDTESSLHHPNANQTANTAQDDPSKLCKKRSKAAKKNTKLDAKSKLEKSRQSARECRARKKLRYQYLEDLVCNREKAVIKLKEELSVFCDLSKQIDVGTISEKDRRLLSDQSKESF